MPSPLQGFDQVVAITQDNINASLDIFFQLTPDLANLNVSGEWGEIKAVMAPATVLLYIPSEPFKINFCVNLSSGTCKWPSLDSTTTPKFYSADIKDWSLVFTVNLDLEEIHKLPSAVASKITIPGSYSLSQLLLDFTTAKLSTFNTTLSKTPGVDEKDPSRASAFRKSIAAYPGHQAQKGDNIISYPITVPANPSAPSFPPISVQFQTAQNKGAGGSQGPAGLSCFLFLEMTNKDRTPPKSITWTQNWADKGMSGSIVISKANFWDRFFVPNITSLNSGALKMLNQVAHTLDNDSFNSNAAVPWSITDNEPSGAVWTSNGTNWTFKWSNSDPNRELDWLEKLSRSYDTEVVITPDAAGKAVNATAKSHVSRNYTKSTPARHTPSRHKYESDATVNWGYSFTLGSIANGKLAISSAIIPPKSTVTVKNTNVHVMFGPSDEELSATAQNALRGRVDGSCTASLLGDVKPAAQFVFPGGSILFVRDPKFNSDGDLAVSLEYREAGRRNAGRPRGAPRRRKFQRVSLL